MSQNKKSSVHLGPGAASLILIFVVLSMSVLGMLSLMNGKNAADLSDRSARVIEAVYALNAKAEETRAEIDAILLSSSKNAEGYEEYIEAIEEALPGSAYLDGDLICWVETDGLRTLELALKVLPLDEGSRSEWIKHDLYAGTGEEG